MSVTIRWRDLSGTWLVGCVVLFVVALGYLIGTPGIFQPVHKLLMVLASVALIYGCLVRLLNVTQIRRDGDVVVVTHGPLPWRGALQLPVAEVALFRCERAGSRLLLRTCHGEDILLLSDVPAASQEALATQLRERLQLPTA